MRSHPRRIEQAGELPPQRVRARLTAYIYGNVLVLGAVATATPETIESGHAVVVVLATTVTTYLAHVFAHEVGAAVSPEVEGQETERQELRDALPIISSGTLPALVLAAGALSPRIDLGLAEFVAIIVVVVRLAGTGALVTRLGGPPSSARRTFWAGIGIAAVGLLIAALKTWLLH